MVDSFVYLGSSIDAVGGTILIFVEEFLYLYMHEIARPGNLALLNITSYQAQTLQCLYSSGADDTWSDRSVETTC